MTSATENEVRASLKDHLNTPEERMEEESTTRTEADVETDGNNCDNYGDELDDDEDSDGSESSEEGAIDESVMEEMMKLEETFKGIGSHYRLINRIGEGTHCPYYLLRRRHRLTNYARCSGTFSTVYKAEDILYRTYDNGWDLESSDASRWSSPPTKVRRTGGASSFSNQQRRKPRFVAIKKIYVTSSPSRILNELELLHDLRGCKAVCPLITAFRHQDQVIAVLPYFRHQDFRVRFA